MLKNVLQFPLRMFRTLVPRSLQPVFKRSWRIVIGTPLIIAGYLKGRQLATARPKGASPRSAHPASTQGNVPSPLEDYFDAHKEGPGIWKWRHYFDIYHRHFAKFIGKEVRILEIGIYSGGSLDMWKEYFGDKCVVYGVDIEEACKSYESESVNIYIGDQADRKFWRRFRDEVPPVDIIVDDGGHKTHQQIVTLEEMFPHLRPGGVYMCEDVQNEFNPFQAYVYGLTRNLDELSFSEEGDGIKPNAIQRIVNSVHQYPFVVVLEKSSYPINTFTAPKHGTQWQPFFSKTHSAKDNSVNV